MAAAGDTEITLGTGKMLLLFFGLVALCAVFFGMGFSFGKNSVKAQLAPQGASLQTAENSYRPSALKSPGAASAPDPALKPVSQKPADAQPVANAASNAAETSAQPVPSAPAASDSPAPPSLNGYFVQVAAVSKQEDADALVDALKKKQYPAFSANSSSDKFIRVQVGPFGDIKEAEAVRARLVSDGYNPILKK